MSAINKETGVHTSSRKLFKGNLVPPCPKPAPKSYTVTPASASEVTIIKDKAKAKATRPQPIAISSMAVPQPFVDPAVLQRRPPPP